MNGLPQRYGRYLLQRRLGRGGMAEVFRASVDGPGGFSRTVAIKRILPEYSRDAWFARMIADEARIVSRLAHPNVVQVLETGQIDDSWFIAFELVDGLDLFALLQQTYGRGKALPHALAAYIVSEVAAALDHAHSRRDEAGEPLGIVHRDVSPQNVLLSWVGEVKLGDFGIARAIARSSETQAGTIKGKIYYMSPEQARGERVDHRSDLFSAGILLYELLCTQPMYDHDDPLRLLELVAAGQWRWPPDADQLIPKPLLEVAAKALAPEREARYQSGRQLREALGAAMAACGLQADRDALGAWLRAENQVPEDRPPTVRDTAIGKRWHTSHLLQLAEEPRERIAANEATRLQVAAMDGEARPSPRVVPRIVHAPPPPHWHLPLPVPIPPPLPPPVDPAASPTLLLLTSLVWLLALVLATLGALMARA